MKDYVRNEVLHRDKEERNNKKKWREGKLNLWRLTTHIWVIEHR